MADIEKCVGIVVCLGIKTKEEKYSHSTHYLLLNWNTTRRRDNVLKRSAIVVQRGNCGQTWHNSARSKEFKNSKSTLDDALRNELEEKAMRTTHVNSILKPSSSQNTRDPIVEKNTN
jgi:hypothetical protein